MINPNYPPGTRPSDIDSEPCPICGLTGGCDCEPDGDPMSYRERMEIEKGEDKFEKERCE